MGRTVYSTDPTRIQSPTKTQPKDVPPNQQKVYVERSRKGRKGKTVTIVSELQHPPVKLKKILKQLKGQRRVEFTDCLLYRTDLVFLK